LSISAEGHNAAFAEDIGNMIGDCVIGIAQWCATNTSDLIGEASQHTNPERSFFFLRAIPGVATFYL
jgi:hypothetical protein